ncbi:hypothetical protein UPYG_G00233160 [Umbra pygmaea]|uniref:Myb-like domain-containing protein n=1 Tax=Umbra pygmaea TaxID=75934 RepID=A0ABD0X1Q3_UMBPY
MASMETNCQTLELNVVKKEEEEEVKICEYEYDSQGEKKTRTAYFTPVELEILMTAYAAYEPTFKRKSNTMAAAKERELAWQKIAERVNACNPTGTKRTWQQLKMKYKNILQTANRKKADARRTGGGPPTLSEAEEMALSHKSRRPITEGISGVTSSDPTSPQDTSAHSRVTDAVITLEPSVMTDVHADDDDDEDTLSATIKREHAERPIESKAGNYKEEGPSTSTAQLASLPVKQLYKVYLEKQIQKCDLEMDHIRLQTQKTKMELQLLEHQMEGIKNTP